MRQKSARSGSTRVVVPRSCPGETPHLQKTPIQFYPPAEASLGLTDSLECPALVARSLDSSHLPPLRDRLERPPR